MNSDFSNPLSMSWGSFIKFWNSERFTRLNSVFSSLIQEQFYGLTPADDSPLPKNLEALPSIYEKAISSSQLHRHGTIYTPPAVASMMCPLIHETKMNAPRFLDPSCGSGTFLLAIFNELAKDLPTNPPKTLSTVITGSLHGIDIDSGAVIASQMLITTAVACMTDENFALSILPLLQKNIVCGDSLLPEKDFKKGHWIHNDGSFDCIIGNPPFGLSRGDKLTGEENELLKKKYARFRNGRVNKYLLFIGRGLDLLKDGGFLSFIVPNAWLGIKEGEAIRRLLINDGGLYEIVLPQADIFPNAEVETVIFKAQKKILQKKISLLLSFNDSNKNNFSVSTERCKRNPGFMIPTRWTDRYEELANHIEEVSISLGDKESPYSPRIALQAYAAGKGTPAQSVSDAKNRIYHRDKKESDDTYPYLEGSDICRYQLNWSGSYLKHGQWLAEPQNISRFVGPRILLREIVGTKPNILHAVFTKEPFLYNKSILHITTTQLPANSESSLLGLCGLLNSKLISAWLSILGRKSQRKLFPKIVLDDLKSLPLPRNQPSLGSKLGALSYQAHLENSAMIESEINDIIFSLYSLSTSHIETICAILKK